LQDVFDDVLVGVEFHDVTADIFHCRIVQQLELGLVRVKDGSVGTDQVQRDAAILEKILKVETGQGWNFDQWNERKQLRLQKKVLRIGP
jgi:hypothetical protein